MIERIQQLAVLDMLLANWSTILVRLGPTTPALAGELARFAARLERADDADRLAPLVDDLLDLVQDTAAGEYVSQLIRRATLGTESVVQTRDALSAAPVEQGELAAAWENNLCAGREFGRVLAATTEQGVVPLYFVTNRAPVTPDQGFFGVQEGEGISCGLARVTIPVAAHRMGQVERPAWWRPLADPHDSRRYVVVGDVEQLTPESFHHRLGRDAGMDDLVLFLHGYNVTFEEAAQRAAQLAYDLRIRGRLLLFSWPSQGALAWYLADEERAALSAAPLHALLRLLADGPWGRVHLLAHSMGNRVLLSGLVDRPWPNDKLSQIVLVAADLPVSLFRQKFPLIRNRGDRYTSYVSHRDRALWLSSLLHRIERVGISRGGEPFVAEGLETIDASAVDTGLLGLGHSYFGDERSVLSDLGYLLREGLPAGRRGFARDEERGYWYFPR